MEEQAWQSALSSILDYESVPWEEFQGCTILVTGATGMVGASILACIHYINKRLERPIKPLAFVRDRDKALRLLGDTANNVEFIIGDITVSLDADCDVDYIIHAAAITSSESMSKFPVEVADATLLGIRNILTFAQKKNIRKLVYLSSMEVYGSADESIIKESDYWVIDPLLVRSCYPEAKRMAENYCCSYYAEYGIPVVIARLAQTFGPGVRSNDNRVFAYFARCAMAGENIVLRTSGKSSNTYVYTVDAVAALFTLLAKGEPGNAYNVANPDTYCSIYDMAEMVCECLAQEDITVVLDNGNKTSSLYPPDHYWNLDIHKIEQLGWHPRTSLIEMYTEMMRYMNESG